MRTKLTLDWGTLAHLVWGLLACLLDQLWLFSLLYVLKQIGDFHAGEPWEETSGDLVEYSGALVAGLILRQVGVFPV